VDLARHEIAHGPVDHPVPFQVRAPVETGGDDQDGKMPAAGRGARMSRVQVRVIRDFEAFRRQALRIADDGLDRDTIRRSFLFDAYYRKLSKLAGVKG